MQKKKNLHGLSPRLLRIRHFPVRWTKNGKSFLSSVQDSGYDKKPSNSKWPYDSAFCGFCKWLYVRGSLRIVNSEVFIYSWNTKTVAVLYLLLCAYYNTPVELYNKVRHTSTAMYGWIKEMNKRKVVASCWLIHRCKNHFWKLYLICSTISSVVHYLCEGAHEHFQIFL